MPVLVDVALGTVALGRGQARAPGVAEDAAIALAAGAMLLPAAAGAARVRIRAVAALGAGASSKRVAELGLRQEVRMTRVEK